ncbi:MAG TPA: glycosyltransferase [Flavobacterium sp.]|uniref:glycosyltransferase family 2 protein n=1 Tax=Flavobacterium sp. TaxID=239 RepID=UPI002C56BE98|nr:glycosyltransferase [Flavobacterium sp.]HNP33127.1 glycosyltransferase [Flavobacterium sp.]
MKKLSIIIPAYKVDDYIEKCIRSLSNQDLPKDEYEIIVTNDGSPDRCREIVEGLQLEFSNLILINQENQGVSMARNNAIAIAKGEYILPIDPDDYVVPNVLKSVYENAKSRNLDVLYLAYEIFDKQGKSVWETDYASKDNIVFDGVDGYFAPRSLEMKDPDRSWAVLYRLEMLNQHGINYPKNVPFLEDGLFLGKVFAVAERVGFSSAKFYQRTIRMGSATNSRLLFSKKAIDGFLLAVNDLMHFAQTIPNNSKKRGLINHVTAKFVFLPLTSCLKTNNFRVFIEIIKSLKNMGLKKIDLQGCNGTYLKYGRAYNKSIVNFMLVYYNRLFKMKYSRN